MLITEWVIPVYDIELTGCVLLCLEDILVDSVNCYSIVVAAGKSTRMGYNKKQYLNVNGIPLLARTLIALQLSSHINSIVLVIDESEFSLCNNEIIMKYKISKVSKLVPGGLSRQQSVYSGLRHIPNEVDVVMVHDGARPFISERIIKENIEEAYKYGAACTVMQSKDTIIMSKDDYVETIFLRDLLRIVQTPQTFRLNILREAFKKAIDDGFEGTDESGLVVRTGIKVKLVMGSYDNIKVTTPDDLYMADKIAKNLKNEVIYE